MCRVLKLVILKRKKIKITSKKSTQQTQHLGVNRQGQHTNIYLWPKPTDVYQSVSDLHPFCCTVYDEHEDDIKKR